MASSLEEFLAWLTDDAWVVEFAPRCTPSRSSEEIAYLFGADHAADYVALFSGGLDSVVGVALDLADGRCPFLVSAVSNTRMQKSQQDTHGLLQEAFGKVIPQIGVNLNLRGGTVESSQRARGFGFLSMAAATAISLDLDLIRVYENGVGAINLPYVAGQLGAHGTRSMHPVTLDLASRLFSELHQKPIRIENPHRVETKAEMCRRAPSQAYKAMAASRSCDMAFTARKPQPWNCGRCTSCILRRQSLVAAGLGSLDSETPHESDMFLERPAAPGSPADLPLESMLTQAGRLQEALRGSQPELGLIEAFPEVSLVAPAGILGRHATRRELVRMYTTYVNEWAALPCGAVPRFLDPAADIGMRAMSEPGR